MDLQRQIDIKNAYLEMIRDIGFDYDGRDNVEDLKNLIDELLYYTRLAIDNNDKEVIYISHKDGKEQELNILSEDIN